MGFTCLFRQLQLHFETQVEYHKINLLVTKCKNVSFDISLKNILGNGNVIIKVVMRKKETVQNYHEF
jgi:hypothetical protein